MTNTITRNPKLIKKAPIIPLLTLSLDEILITRCINIFKKYLKRLGIEDVTIINKLFIFKGDFFLVNTIIKVIY